MSRPASRSGLDLALRVLAALALGVSSYLHVDLAVGPRYTDGQITLAGLFVAQAVVAAVVAVWVLALGGLWAWAATGAVGAASLAALVLSVYVEIPSIGPFPTVYEPFWYDEKVAAAVAAGLAALLALLALGRARGRGRGTSRTRARTSRT